MATYRVVDLHENLSEGGEHLRVELPHLRLDADPARMSADERRQAAARLQETLDRLAPAPRARRVPKVTGRTESGRASDPPVAPVAEPEG